MNQKTNRKKRIFLTVVILVITLFISLAFEFFTNTANSIPNEKRELLEINNLNLKLDGAVIKNDEIQSVTDKACITLKEDYERVLRLEFKEKNGDTHVLKIGDVYTPWSYGIPPIADDFDTTVYSYNLNEKNKEIKIYIPEQGSQIVSLQIDNRYIFNWYKFCFSEIILLSIVFLLYSYRKKLETEKTFLILSLLLTMSFSVLLPITTAMSWDEQIHYSRVVQLLPYEIQKTDISLGNRAVPTSYNIKDQSEQLRNAEKQVDNEAIFIETATEPITIGSLYKKLAYFPSAATRLLLSLFGCSSTILFIAGRMANGLCYSAIVYFAIRRLKSAKLILAIISLSPTAVFLASVYSYDWWVIAFLELGSAYLIRELQEPKEKLELKNLLIMLGAFIIACGPKAIYFPIILCCLLLGKDKYDSRKKHRLSNSIYLVSSFLVASSFVVPIIFNGAGTGDSRGGSGVNATEQISYILNNPTEYTKTLVSFLVKILSPNSFCDTFSRIGYPTSSNEIFSIIAGTLLLVMVLISCIIDRNEYDKQVVTYKNIVTITTVNIIIIVLISTALYVSFTPVALNTINGVQPRYLLPILFLGFSVIGRKANLNKDKRNIYNKIILAIVSLLCFMELWTTVISNYY